MSEKKVTYGFGYDPAEAQNHFYVVIPDKTSDGPVRIYERFAWNTELEQSPDQDMHGDTGKKEPTFANGQKLAKRDILRNEISKHKWSLLVKDVTAEFNSRLKEEKKTPGKFVIGGTPLEKLFGKELMVLLWGVEDCDPTCIPTAVKNWKGLMPEERWWLYTMTNASTGGLKDRKGWRTALRYALCENPIEEDPQITMNDFWGNGDLI